MLRRLLLIILLVSLIAPAALLSWLLVTESGLAFIAGQLGRLERFGVRIDGAAGTLRGPLSIERIEVDTRTVHIVATGIEAEPLLRATVLQTVAFDWLRVASLDVGLKDTGEDSREEPSRGPRFVPQWLRVLGERVEIGATRFATAGGFELVADRVAGRLELTHDVLHVSDLIIEATEYVAGASVRLESGEALEIDVVANGRLTFEQRPEVELAATLHGTGRRLAIDARLESPGDAHATVTILREASGWRLEGRVDADDPQLGAWLDDPPVTPRDMHVALQMTPEGFTVSGEVTVPEVDEAPVELEATGRYHDRTLTITQARVRPQAAAALLSLSGTTRFTDERPVLDLLLEWDDLVWPLRDTPVIHSPEGRLAVNGALPYRIDGSAQLDVPGQPSADVAVTGNIDDERLTLAAVTVAGAPGNITGRGTLDLAEPRRWQFDLRGTGIDLSPWLPDFPSQINVAATVAGSGLDARATASARIDSIGGTLRGLPLDGSGTVERKRAGWRAQQLELSAGANRISVDGEVADRIDAHWTVDAREIETLLPHAAGRVRFSGEASGPVARPVINARLDGSDLRYEGRSLRTLNGTAHVDLGDRESSRIAIDATDIGREETVIANAAFTVDGRATDHELRFEATLVPAAEGEPAATLLLRARGEYRERTWSGAIQEFAARLGADDTLFSLQSPARLTASADVLELDPLCLLIDGASFCTHGSWQAGGPWSASGTLDRLPLEVLGDVLPGRPAFGGHITGRFAVQGDGATLTEGTAGLRLVDGEIRYQLVGGDLDRVEFGSGEVSLNATPQSIIAEGRLDASDETFIEAQLNVAREPARTFRDQSVSGTIRARSNDTGAISLVVPELDDVAGRIEADFGVYGTLGAPRFDGSLALREGKVELYRFNTLLEDIDFLARLRDRRIDIEGSSRMGEGTLEVDGSLIWRDLQPNGIFQLRGENLLIADSPELRIVASPDLEFDVTGRSLVATGEVVIPSARIEPRDLGTAASVSTDARIVGDDAAQADAERGLDVRTQIRVTLGDDVTIDAVGLTGRLDGSLVTRSGYSEVETGRGEIRVVDGKYEAYGQKLDIIRGRLIFDGTTLGDPGLDIQAEKEVAAVTVGLNVRGTLRDPRLSLYSDPSMPQNQILSYLLIGKPIDEAGDQDARTVSNAANSLAMSGGGFLASQIGRQIGLEEVAIEAQGEEDTALVLGKFLSPRLFVSYGISLTESINTAKLRYTISDSWVLKVEAGEHQSADLEFEIER